MIGTDAFTVTELGNGVTRGFSGLYVSDTDATASTDTFTVSVRQPATPGGSVTPSTGSGSRLGRAQCSAG